MQLAESTSTIACANRASIVSPPPANAGPPPGGGSVCPCALQQGSRFPPPPPPPPEQAVTETEARRRAVCARVFIEPSLCAASMPRFHPSATGFAREFHTWVVSRVTCRRGISLSGMHL